MDSNNQSSPILMEEEHKNRATQRILGLDIVRSLAIIFVICVHFSLNTCFNDAMFAGISMWLQTIARTIFGIGVPLFIILTGYLNINKTPTRKYYRGIWKVVIAYIVFSIVTIVFRKYYLHDDISLLRWGMKILDFSAIPYGWYIEMWIGLFLFTPFLNMLYKAIPIQKQKIAWIVILFSMTAIPELFNRYGLHLVPGFWQNCYPLLFFYIGCYMKEYQPRIKPIYCWVTILGCCLINPLFNALFIHNHSLIQITGDVSKGVFGTIIAIMFFLLVYHKDVQTPIIRKGFTKVSLLSLDIYLCCYIFDAIYYPWFKEHYFVNQSQFGIFIFVIVPLVFISSLVLSQIKEYLFSIFKVEHLWK